MTPPHDRVRVLLAILLAATAPVLMGALRDLSGWSESGVWALVVLAAAAAVLAVTAVDGRTAR